MLTEWETPVRKVGSKVLDPIAMEVYIKIFDYQLVESDGVVTPQYDWTMSRLALVCKLFYALALSRRYNTFKINLASLYSGPKEPRFVVFCRKLKQKDKFCTFLAQNIKVVEFQSTTNTLCPYKHELPDLVKLYASSLALMPNLHTLRMSTMAIDASLLREVTALQNLRVLSVDNCTFDYVGLPSSVINNLSKLKLEGFETTDSSNNGFNQILTHVNRTNLMKIFGISSTDILSYSSGPYNRLQNLQQLRLTSGGITIGQVLQLLRNIPTLQDLDVSKFEVTLDAASAKIYATHNLTRLVVNANSTKFIDHLLKFGAPNRLIIKGNGEFSPGELARTLEGHSLKIKILEIPSSVFDAMTEWREFSNLEYLLINFYSSTKRELMNFEQLVISMLQKACNKGGSLPSLRTLKLLIPFYPGVNGMSLHSLPWQLEQLLKIDARFYPTIDLFFIHGVEWHRQVGSSSWKPSVPFARQRDVIDNLLKYGNWRDYDKCFETLLKHSGKRSYTAESSTAPVSGRERPRSQNANARTHPVSKQDSTSRQSHWKSETALGYSGSSQSTPASSTQPGSKGKKTRSRKKKRN